jgi:putative DNA primase/helicase
MSQQTPDHPNPVPIPPEDDDDGEVFYSTTERIRFHIERSGKRGQHDGPKAQRSYLWLKNQGLLAEGRGKKKKQSAEPPLPQGSESRKRWVSLTCINEIEEEEYEWTWPGRIPRRTVSLIAGDGGAGKSTLTGSLIACITTGAPWPDAPGGLSREPGNVVILSAEENAATDIRPRLSRHGADLSRVHIMTSTHAPDGTEDRFSLSRDVPYLSLAVAAIGNVHGVFIDPIGSYLSGSDTGNDAEVQHALNPLFKLAEDHRLAAILIAHLTKQSSADIQARIQGSAAFVNKSRMVWFYSTDPRDHSRRLLSFIKGNPVDKTTTGLSVGFKSGQVVWDPSPVHLTAKQVAFQLAQQAMRGEIDGKPGPKTDRTMELQEFIIKRLGDGAIKLKTLLEEAEDALDAKRATVYLAIKRLAKRVHEFKGEKDGRKWIELTPELELRDGDTPEARNDAPETPIA